MKARVFHFIQTRVKKNTSKHRVIFKLGKRDDAVNGVVFFSFCGGFDGMIIAVISVLRLPSADWEQWETVGRGLFGSVFQKKCKKQIQTKNCYLPSASPCFIKMICFNNIFQKLCCHDLNTVTVQVTTK